MKLVAFGDSWVHGDELTPNTPLYRNSVNIGGLVNKDFKFTEYINYANNGASNERIVLQIMEYKNSKNYSNEDFILVGLSSPSRNLTYINHKKTPLTLPSWNLMHVVTSDPEHTETDLDYINWFDRTGFYTLNNRNELVKYSLNLLSIKSLLADNHKYLIFQSIDNINKLYDNVEMNSWNEINLHWDVGGVQNTKESTIFFNKDYIKSEINSQLKKTQKWINFEFQSWRDFLYSKESYEKYLYKTHPNELGHEIWYNEVIRQYIKNIL